MIATETSICVVKTSKYYIYQSYQNIEVLYTNLIIEQKIVIINLNRNVLKNLRRVILLPLFKHLKLLNR